MPAPLSEEEYLRFTYWLQALLVVVIAVVGALAITGVVDHWSDWLVLGVIVGTVDRGLLHRLQPPVPDSQAHRQAGFGQQMVT